MAFIISIFILLMFIFGIYWEVGCIPISLSLNSNLNQFIGNLLGPLLCLWGVSIFGQLIPAINQKTKKKRLLVFALFILSLFSLISSFGWLFIVGMEGRAACPDTPRNRQYAIELTQKWGGLKPLPKSAIIIHTNVTGGAFTRGVSVTFEGKPHEINNWLENSPGTKGLEPEKLENGNLKYDLEAREGAILAEVVVSANRTVVTIRGTWS